jgi:hypothetical protein
VQYYKKQYHNVMLHAGYVKFTDGYIRRTPTADSSSSTVCDSYLNIRPFSSPPCDRGQICTAERPNPKPPSLL